MQFKSLNGIRGGDGLHLPCLGNARTGGGFWNLLDFLMQQGRRVIKGGVWEEQGVVCE